MYVRVYNQNESNIYIIWFIRDLPVGLHTALCSTTDRFSPKNKVYCLSTGVYKCSLLLTSYFSKKIVVGEIKKSDQITWMEWTVCRRLKWVYRTSLLLLIRMSNCFFSKSISRTAGASPVIPELGEGLKCWLVCSEQHTSYHTFSTALFVLLNRFWEFTFHGGE